MTPKQIAVLLVALTSAALAKEQLPHANDNKVISEIACLRPSNVAAQDIQDRSVTGSYSRVDVTCATHGQDSGFPVRARTTCTKTAKQWQCRPRTLYWSMPTGLNVVDVEVTNRVPADHAAELIRYAASIREFQRIPVAAMVAGRCRVEPDGKSNWLLHCAGLTLAIARDCANGGCRLRAFATQRKLVVD
jgi:hypothetical protein